MQMSFDVAYTVHSFLFEISFFCLLKYYPIKFSSLKNFYMTMYIDYKAVLQCHSV